MTFGAVVEWIGRAVEFLGVMVTVGGVLASLVLMGRRLWLDGDGDAAYTAARRNIGRSVLLGLEILVAGDIIRTVVIDPSLTSIAVLAGIVAIRTFLSFVIEAEITGTLPWRGDRSDRSDRSD